MVVRPPNIGVSEKSSEKKNKSRGSQQFSPLNMHYFVVHRHSVYPLEQPAPTLGLSPNWHIASRGAKGAIVGNIKL